MDAQLSRDGTTLALTGPTVTGTRFTYSFRMESFTSCDNGNYVCTATVSLRSPSPYVTGNVTMTGQAIIAVGKTKNYYGREKGRALYFSVHITTVYRILFV